MERVKLRCVNKTCSIKTFWTALKFVEIYTKNLGCFECKGKVIKDLRIITKDLRIITKDKKWKTYKNLLMNIILRVILIYK